ncbi:hypothetical protein Goklo_002931 [Gossypium klotzschianum]|uniref:Uncharacterized protein n=1 Tax=Gossypium klotzschianum TaxID=34286 RepID=A0A7J8VV68_9ROSI|nr:hypothetical protein [Gossypium klotzschianum]
MLVPDLLHFQLGLLARISKSVLVPLVVERLELFLESSILNVYHCPFCNLCRVGKGLGDDFFHSCLIINSALFFVRHMHAVITSAQFVANRWEIWR